MRLKTDGKHAVIASNSHRRLLICLTMAEARTEDEEDSLRESRGGRNPRLAASVSSERAERNKPEQRHSSSQGALSSIRAAIKRTSNRTTAQTDHNRDRRRPEITILSAEPLATNSWFPGASGAFPPPPPPAQPSWASSGLTVHLPPPSYEQVIREKSREQNIPPPAVSCSSSSTSTSSSPTPRLSSVTIATQTDKDSSKSKKRTGPPARRPPKPPRPSLPLIPKPAETSPSNTHSLIELGEPDQPFTTHTPATTHGSDILSHKPLSEQCGVQTDFSTVPNELALLEATPASTDSAQNPPPVKREVSARPRPRPRSKAILPPITREKVLNQPMTGEVKVQTLVRLKDDGAENVFAGFTDSSSDVSSNKYLQELLDAFGYDEQGFQGNQSSESDQSDQSEEEETEEEKDEKASESLVAATVVASVPSEPLEPLKRPEPRPRTQNPKPMIAEKTSERMQGVQEPENAPEDKGKQIVNPPVPAPRPLLTNKISEGNKPDTNILPRPARPPVAARRSLVPSAQAQESVPGHQTAEVVPKPFIDDQHVEEQARNPSSAPAKPTPVTSASSSSGKSPSGPSQISQAPAKPPFQRRPPPPSTTNAQAGVSVSKAPASSVPSLPPRPSEGKMLPHRPPPMKLPKSSSSSHVSATTNQLPSQRVPKRGPPLPPRPKPGHPLYKDYTSKVPQGNTKMSHPGTEPEKRCLQQKEELLLDLDDTHTPTQTASVPSEVKGLQARCDDVCPAVKDEPISQQKQNQERKREQQEEQQQPQPNTVRFVSRFAFEGEGDELTFCEGDVITLIEYVNEEWGRGSLDGHTGLFPLNFVQEERTLTPESPAPPAYEEGSRTGRAMYDFISESEDELCLKVGDIVCALEEVDEEWYMGEFGGKRGIVPKNYIQVL